MIQEEIDKNSVFLTPLWNICKGQIVGQEAMLRSLIMALLAKGHVLLEGLPGLAKTMAIKTLAGALDGSFSRIQFTPDLLPADILGTLIYDPSNHQFKVHKGPIFAHFVLADEVNRAPAKVQSALLECMQERQVTIGDKTYPLEEPFMVLATQNPIEQQGTFNLPEAQLDRFMFKVLINYPEYEEEREIIRRNALIVDIEAKRNEKISINHILEARNTVDKIYLDYKIEKYILDLVFCSRFPERYGLASYQSLIAFGASPRASIYLAIGAKVVAFTQKRAFVLPEDVRMIFKDVMRHRVGLEFEAEAQGLRADDFLDEILRKVPLP